MKEFCDEKGGKPFTLWLNQLDSRFQIRIFARIARFEDGNFGDHKRVTKDIYEARFFFGSGFRLYFAKMNKKIVLLLCGGDKSTQSRDLKKAQVFFEKYMEDMNHA